LADIDKVIIALFSFPKKLEHSNRGKVKEINLELHMVFGMSLMTVMMCHMLFARVNLILKGIPMV